MFPWVDGFHWTATHIIFLSLFFSAMLIILSTFVRGIWRAYSDFCAHRVTAMCWRENFNELPEADRHCRHQLAGRVDSRTCDNAFDCRGCPNYANFAGLPASVPGSAGVSFSNKLLYHRGHTWVRPEEDGSYTIGLDEFAQCL